MLKKKRELLILAPIGDVPPKDRYLNSRIKNLPRDSNIADVFRVIGEWEKTAVKKDKELEQTKKSGRLG